MSSTRLRGKVLMPLVGDKCILDYLLEGLRRCVNIDQILIATSDREDDDAIEKYCKGRNVECFRGSLLNVAGRFLSAARSTEMESFVRVCADSPLLDYMLVDKMVGIYREEDFDLVTNIQERTFPKGQSVEVVKTETFERAYEHMTEDRHFEHVTGMFYENPENYRIYNLKSTVDYGWLQMSVDTDRDAQIANRVISLLNRPHWEYSLQDKIRLWMSVSKQQVGVV